MAPRPCATLLYGVEQAARWCPDRQGRADLDLRLSVMRQGMDAVNGEIYRLPEPPPPRWQEMSALRVVMTLGAISALLFAAAFVLGSKATGLAIPLGAIFFAWLGFCCVVPPAAMVMAVLASFVGTYRPLGELDETGKRLVVGRLLLVCMGVGAQLWVGVPILVDGWQNNRFAEPERLVRECTAPRTEVRVERYKECRDGWASQSIGKRGACSHHGGVVERKREVEKTIYPSGETCLKEALARSWLD